MTLAVFDLLRDAMRQRFDGSLTRLADACGVSVQLASRWVSENEKKRITPSPGSCEKIADALGLEPTYVMQLAGHMAAPSEQSEPDPVEQMIRARADEMRTAVQGTPRVFWATIINATFDRAIGGARDMARLLAEADTASASNSGHVEPSAKTPDGTPIQPQRNVDGGLAGPHRQQLVLVGAR